MSKISPIMVYPILKLTKVNFYVPFFIKMNNKKSTLTAMCNVGSNPALATCETSLVLLVGVPGGFSRGSHVFAYLLIGPSHMS